MVYNGAYHNFFPFGFIQRYGKYMHFFRCPITAMYRMEQLYCSMHDGLLQLSAPVIIISRPIRYAETQVFAGRYSYQGNHTIPSKFCAKPLGVVHLPQHLYRRVWTCIPPCPIWRSAGRYTLRVHFRFSFITMSARPLEFIVLIHSYCFFYSLRKLSLSV